MSELKNKILKLIDSVSGPQWLSDEIVADKIIALTTQKDAGLVDLVTKMRVLSDDFEEQCCGETEEFERGQHDGKSLAYEACANMLNDLLRRSILWNYLKQ